MGSQSDWPTMRHAADILDELAVPYETKVVSAHRMPDAMFAYAGNAAGRGLIGCTSSFKALKRCRFFAFYCANAERHSGGNISHWRCWGSKRGLVSGGNASDQRCWSNSASTSVSNRDDRTSERHGGATEFT